MARHASAPVAHEPMPSPFVEDLVTVEEVVLAVRRGLGGEELLEELSRLASDRYNELLRARPHRPLTFRRGDIVAERPAVIPQPSPQIQGARAWTLSGYKRSPFRDPETFLAEVDAMS